MESTVKIETVLFDYGMVLTAPPDPVAWARMRTITGLDEERYHEAYWHFRHDYDRAALTAYPYWRAVGERAGIVLSDTQVEELLVADVDVWTVPNQPMIDFAGRLQRAGVRTGILSNIGDAIAHGIVARLAWLSDFYHCTWSYELHMAKPEPEIFLKTAKALETSPANILFFDDKKENTDAAAALGMQVVQYTGHAAFELEMRSRGLVWLLESGMAAAADAAPVVETV